MIQVTEVEFRGAMAKDNVIGGPCLEVRDEYGDLMFIAMIRPEGEMLHRVRAISSQIDASRGR
jgi:hypothetical protein